MTDDPRGEQDTGETGDTSRAALRALFDSALDAIIVVDDEAKVVGANPAAAELLDAGARRDTGLLVRADGDAREVEYAATANFLPGRHLWMLRDVTERNRALREAQFHAKLLDHLDAAVVAVDTQGRVSHWNAAAERLYGVPSAETIGQDVRGLASRST